MDGQLEKQILSEVSKGDLFWSLDNNRDYYYLILEVNDGYFDVFYFDTLRHDTWSFASYSVWRHKKNTFKKVAGY